MIIVAHLESSRFICDHLLHVQHLKASIMISQTTLMLYNWKERFVTQLLLTACLVSNEKLSFLRTMNK